SLLFLFIFLPIVLIIYFISPKQIKNTILFISSLIFYAWGEPVYVVLMLFSTVVDYTHGILVEKYINQDKRKKAKMVVASSMIINLLLLGFFKYSDFLIANINSLLGTTIPLLNLALPIGISFYTFQTMSYTVDVYRGQAKAQKNIISFGTYVALFPQLIAGPIVQYKTIADQLDSRVTTVDNFSDGINRFMVGISKKVLLANNIGMLYDQIAAMENPVAVTAWIGIIAFAFQIYFDFSGYSDMAIGLGKIFGFEFLENFNYPYISKSATEFWRRWHISLGSWFKEYVYIPLGGNRNHHIRNLLIVWALTGIWHGASWNFLFWGLYFGVILIIEKFFLLKHLEKLPAFVGHIYTLIIVLFSWVIFAFDNLSKMGNYFMAMFGANGFFDTNTAYILLTYSLLFVMLILGSTPFPKKLAQKLFVKKPEMFVQITKSVAYVILFGLSVAYIVDASYNPFLYFRF
ncbi:MAG: MBOAT family O-acyltransferase, partial [Oscillospiraceae bacterium]